MVKLYGVAREVILTIAALLALLGDEDTCWFDSLDERDDTYGAAQRLTNNDNDNSDVKEKAWQYQRCS